MTNRRESCPAVSFACVPFPGTGDLFSMVSWRRLEGVKNSGVALLDGSCPVGQLGCSLCAAGSGITLHWRVLPRSVATPSLPLHSEVSGVQRWKPPNVLMARPGTEAMVEGSISLREG